MTPITFDTLYSDLERLFAAMDEADYLGESVSTATHQLQAATMAQGLGADDSVVAAALLHDIGHFVGPVLGTVLMATGTDNRHEEDGADWLAQYFPASVAEPVRLHVAAKRFLSSTEAGYYDALSDASKFTMSVQGGPMSDEEQTRFRKLEYSDAACVLRRCDDGGKDAAAEPRSLSAFRRTLERVFST